MQMWVPWMGCLWDMRGVEALRQTGQGEERVKRQRPTGGQTTIVGTHVAAGWSLMWLAPGIVALSAPGDALGGLIWSCLLVPWLHKTSNVGGWSLASVPGDPV